MPSLGRDLTHYKVDLWSYKVGPAHKHSSLQMLQRTACIYFVKAWFITWLASDGTIGGIQGGEDS